LFYLALIQENKLLFAQVVPLESVLIQSDNCPLSLAFQHREKEKRACEKEKKACEALKKDGIDSAEKGRQGK
jgi:hypothetical protein